MLRSSCFIAFASGLVLSSTVLKAQDVQTSAKPASRDPYTVPQTDDVAVLAEFIEDITKDRPTSFADIVALESKMPGVMEAANRILVLEKDTNAKAYRLAKRLVLRKTRIREVTQ